MTRRSKHESFGMSPALNVRLRYLVERTSRAAVGDLAGVSAETVRRWLIGEQPSLYSICTLCENLRVSLDWLVWADIDDWSGDPPPRAVARSKPAAHSDQREGRSMAATKLKMEQRLLVGGPAHGTIVVARENADRQLTVAMNRKTGKWIATVLKSPVAGVSTATYEHLLGRGYRWSKPSGSE